MNRQRDDFDTQWRFDLSESAKVWIIAVLACLCFWVYVGEAIWMGFHG